MQLAKNTGRALVYIGHDGKVYKTFRGPHAFARFENEIRILKHLETEQCEFVPRLLDINREELSIVTTFCGAPVERIGDERLRELFEELEQFGVRHDDPFLRNVTYRAADARFCIIDFEFATLLVPEHSCFEETSPLAQLAALLIEWEALE